MRSKKRDSSLKQERQERRDRKKMIRNANKLSRGMSGDADLDRVERQAKKAAKRAIRIKSKG